MHPMLDTRYPIETPEGIDLTIPIAGPVVRILAFSFDIIFCMMLQALIGTTLHLAGQFGAGTVFISSFLILWFYPVYFEVTRNGMTPGKKEMGILVIHDDGTPVTFASSLIRNLLRAVDFLPFAYVAGILTMIFSPQFKRLGDLAARTCVIYSTPKAKLPSIPRCSPLRSPIPLATAEQRAILHFAERHSTLTKARSAELASMVAGRLIPGAPSSATTLYHIANGLAGTDETARI